MLTFLGFSFPDIFKALYKQVWRKAAQAAEVCVDSQSFLENQLLLTASGLPINATGLARRHFRLSSKIYKRVKSYNNISYCPLCIIRRPQVPLPCGHKYCVEDIRLMGREVQKNKFLVSECVVCGRSIAPVQFRFRPKTRGIRVLALDGGGVRGIILLECLKLLESKIQVYLPDWPLINMFDMCSGTSSGKSTPISSLDKDAASRLLTINC